MSPGDQTAESSPGFYPPTLWTQILEARKGSVESEQAWKELVGRYREIIRSQIARRIQDDPDNAAAQFIAFQFQDLVGKADRSKARFRSLLATVLQRFINSELRRRYAAKRGSGHPSTPLDTAMLETVPAEAAEVADVASGLDHEFAEQVFRRAFAQVRQSQQDRLTDAEFELLLGLQSSVPMAEIAARLKISEDAAKVRRCRLVKQWREVIRREVADLVPPGEVEDELRYLARLAGSVLPPAATSP